MCADCWRQAHIEDSWHVQVRAMIHVCGPSCRKYNSNGIRICRHHCYHITILEPDTSAASPAEKPLKLRRDGRPLNNQLFIQEDATKGKRGRIVPITVMPFETMTNYAAAASLRCNFDNQSLLYLPPGSVLKLLHSPNIGRKPEYAHMERKEGDMNPKWLLPVPHSSVETDEVDTRPADNIKTCEALLNSTASRSQAPAETTASTSGNIRQASSKKRLAKTLNVGTVGQDIRKYFKTADNDLSSREQKAQDLSGQQQDRSGRQQDRSSRQQAQSGRQQDQSGRQQNRSGQERLARGCLAKARKDVDKEVSESLEEGNTAVGLFKHRYPLCRTGADDALREFQDAPVPMPPISCLMRGCEHRWFHSREEFLKHCDAMHAGYQSYRNRVLFLLSQTVFQFPGSLQRAAMQNFAEFQCRSETDW